MVLFWALCFEHSMCTQAFHSYEHIYSNTFEGLKGKKAKIYWCFFNVLEYSICQVYTSVRNSCFQHAKWNIFVSQNYTEAKKINNVFVNNFPIVEFGVKVLIQLIFSYKTCGLQIFNRCNFANTYTNKKIVNNATRVVWWVCRFVNRV